MTKRNQEIIRKAGSIADGIAQHYVSQDLIDYYYKGFQEGANWADSTILTKVIEWASNNITFHEKGFMNKEEMVDNLKQYIGL